MDLNLLKRLGLSDKEVRIYLELLKNGPLSVRSLAGQTGINRGTVYDCLKNMQEKGIVGFFHLETKQKFVAEDPDKLNLMILEKEQDLKNVKKSLSELIPQLASLQGKEGRPTTKSYEGIAGIKKILADVLESSKDGEKEYFIYSATKASEDLNRAYPGFTAERIKKGIKVKAISLASGGKTHGLDERKWLGTNDDGATFIIIYNGKCAFVSRDAKASPVGVIIENKMIYKTQKNIFLMLWELLDQKKE